MTGPDCYFARRLKLAARKIADFLNERCLLRLQDFRHDKFISFSPEDEYGYAYIISLSKGLDALEGQVPSGQAQ
jgi:hypothetical protein